MGRYYHSLARLLLIMLIAGLLPTATGLASPPAAPPAMQVAGDDPPPPVGLTVAPLAEAHLPSLTLRLEVAPSPAAIGETVAITLTIANQAPDPAEDLIVALPTPEGALALPGPNTRGPAQGWQWDLGRLEGKAEVTLLGMLRLMRRPAGDALLLHAQAAARGLPLPIHAIGGAVVIARAGDPAAAPFAPGAAARLQSRDGRVQVAFPARAAARALTLRHTYAPRVGAAPPALAGYRRGFGTFFLDATDDQGRAIHQFDQPLAISVGFTSEQLQALGIAESDLTLFWFNETTQRWEAIPTRVDSTAQTATALVDHFSAFQLGDGSSPSSAFIPALQGWQVSTFTGAASYAYPIDVPAGPAGLKPNLTLNYSSAAAGDGDGGKRVLNQAGWVGLGWSLDSGSVAAHKMSNGGVYYTLVLNGQSFDLMRGAALVANPSESRPTDWDWRPTDESFMRVRAVGNGVSTATRGGFSWGTPYPRYTWQIWTKDGTRYDFNEDLWWGWHYCEDSGDYAYMETYKWLLNSVTDTHSNVINYTYGRDATTRPETCFHVQGTVDRDAWPATVSWAGGRYQVNFISSARAADTQFEGAENQYPNSGNAPHQTRQLDAIQVWSNPAGTWQLVRQYNFGYDYSLYSDVLAGTGCAAGQPKCPDFNYPRLTLKAVQRIGNNSTSALPPTTFTYGAFGYAYAGTPVRYWVDGSWNRLTQVNNGQGGLMTLDYDNAGQAANDGLMDNNRRVISKTLNDGRGHTYTTTYRYGTPNINSLGTTRGPQSPWNYNRYGTRAYPNSAALYYNAFTDTVHDSQDQLAHKAMREFRGHDWVIETDPSGGQTRHWFYQGEALDKCIPTVTGGTIPNDACFQRLRDGEFLKGREYRTQVFAPGVDVNSANPLQESLHTFGVIFYDYTTTPKSGLWRAFSYESQVQDEQQEGTTTAVIKSTRYIYEPTYTDAVMGLLGYQNDGQQYGNLTRVEEYDGPLDGRAPVRITEHMFTQLISAGSYIVDREWATVVRDGQRRLLALTQLYYDGNNQSPTTLGAKGDVTRASRFYDLPLQTGASGITLRGPDTTYTYDTYGNRVTESTYPQPGTRNYNGAWTISAPGNGSAARTTTTAYDSVFHAFPTQVTNPLTHVETAGYDYRMGTLTSVTDINGNVTSAVYDVFGRMVTLIRPGDSASFPTVQAYYYDTEQPFRYRIDRRDIAGNAGTRIEQQYYDGIGRKIQVKRESVNVAQNIIVDLRYNGQGQVIEESQPRYVNESGAAFTAYTAPAAPLSNVTTTTYDALGRPRRITTPDGKWTEHLYGIVLVNSVPYTYDDVVDPNRHRMQYRHDALGRLTYAIEISGDCGTSSYSWATCAAPYTTQWAAYATTTYSYSPLDLLNRVTDAAGNATTMTYDTLGRKTRMTDPDMGTWNYLYDTNGNLTRQTDARGQRVCFAYDALGRLTGKHYNGTSDACPATPTTITYTYDAGANGKGQRTGMTSAGDTTSWTYDARGRKTQATHIVAGLTRTFRWTYDSADRVQTITYPAFPNGTAQVITYSYDGAGRPASMYTSIWNVNLISGATYTALDQPDQLNFYNGVIQNWTYASPMQRLSRLQAGPSATPGSIFDRGYGYDNGGNVTAIADNSGTPIPAQSFAYDHLDRLTSWTSGTTTQAYTYNAIGNMTGKAGVAYAYPAAGAARPHTPATVGGAAYAYDANGNLTSGGGRTYTWTAENQPASITSAGVTETYGYDGDGERVKVVRGATATIYLEGLWEEIVGGTGPKGYYSFNGQIAVMYTYSPSAFYYIHNDHLGSASVVTGGGGALASEQEFDPWGKVRSGAVTQTNLNYTGQRLDGTGLLYYHARMYDPNLGRFVSADSIVPDTISGKGGSAATLGVNASSQFAPLTADFHEPGFVSALNKENAFRRSKGFWFQLSDQDRQQAKTPWGPLNPQALNRYSYVLNNPLRYTDPTGHQDCQCGHTVWYITNTQEATDVMQRIADILRAHGTDVEIGTDNGFTIGVPVAAATLGWSQYNFLKGLLSYLDQYRTGAISGPIWIEVLYDVNTNFFGRATVNWGITYGRCLNNQKCDPRDPKNSVRQRTHYYREFPWSVGQNTIDTLMEIREVMLPYEQ